MIDRFGREISYLRISVTDRCNLRCRYCVPAEGAALLPPGSILAFEEIVAVARAAVLFGVTKVRLTGGEPLVRPGVVDLVAMLAAVQGIRDLAMTTNGLLLAEHAQDLARAGLRRVNVSLDSVDPARYREITRGGDLGRVLAGIRSAAAAGLSPVRLNCVVERTSGEPDARAVAAFAEREGLEVRFIRAMDFASGRFSVVEGGTGGDCRRCNRLRLSAEGGIRPCLFSDLSFNVRELGAAEAVRRAVWAKPREGGPCGHRAMQAIGG